MWRKETLKEEQKKKRERWGKQSERRNYSVGSTDAFVKWQLAIDWKKRKEKLRKRKNSFRSCVLCGLCRWERTRLARQIRRRCSSLITLQAAKTGFCRYSQFALPCSEWEAADFPHCRDKQQARHRLNIISYLYTSWFLFTPFFLFRDGTLPKLSLFP